MNWHQIYVLDMATIQSYLQVAGNPRRKSWTWSEVLNKLHNLKLFILNATTLNSKTLTKPYLEQTALTWFYSNGTQARRNQFWSFIHIWFRCCIPTNSILSLLYNLYHIIYAILQMLSNKYIPIYPVLIYAVIIYSVPIYAVFAHHVLIYPMLMHPVPIYPCRWWSAATRKCITARFSSICNNSWQWNATVWLWCNISSINCN